MIFSFIILKMSSHYLLAAIVFFKWEISHHFYYCYLYVLCLCFFLPVSRFSLIMIFTWVCFASTIYFVFILPGIHWASYICGFWYLSLNWKIIYYYLLKYFFSFILFLFPFWDSNYTHGNCFVLSHRSQILCFIFYSFFSLYFSLYSFPWVVLKFTVFSPSAVSSLLLNIFFQILYYIFHF